MIPRNSHHVANNLEWKDNSSQGTLHGKMESLEGNKKKTIMNMARSMLKDKNFLNDFWGVVVACAVYILN